jgi:hypothetical protein
MIRFAVPLILLTALAAGPARAGDADPPPEPGFTAEPFVLQITPYLWAASIDGDVSPFKRAPTVHFEKSFSDILGDLNMAGFVNLWARSGRLVLSGDLMAVDTLESRVVGSLPVIGPTPGVEADVDTRMLVGTLLGGYRVYDSRDLTLDLLAGLRGFHLSNAVTLDTPRGSVSRSIDYGWVDPVVSARAFQSFGEELSVMLQGDVGGFGVGSQLTWQLLGTVNWAFDERVSVSAGYKILAVDYENDGFLFDATLSGPVLGATWRF